MGNPILLAVLFYTGDGILTSPRPAHLQDALDVLTEMFDRVGLQTNVNKTVGMVCQTCYMAGGHSGAAYGRRMMEVGTSFWERQREWVRCPE